MTVYPTLDRSPVNGTASTPPVGFVPCTLGDVQKSLMIADYLQACARWRLDRADPADDGRNARAALALLDAAAYTRALGDSERVVLRLHAAGCFIHGRYNPGMEGEHLIRFWHYDAPEGSPEDLLLELANCAERGLVPAQRARG